MTDRFSGEFAADMERIRADLSKLREDFSGLFHVALDLGRSQAGTAKERLEAGIRELKKAATSVKQTGNAAVEGVQHRVASKPLTSLVLAFGVGLVLGAMIRPRR